MTKIAIIATPVLTLPWWFFPGYEVLQQCVACYFVGQFLSAPFAFLIAGAIYYYIFGMR
tara:strand:+ start:424 stop:600 length:177 start_codon:yes stop_codon:yes gene_type:complete